MTPRPRTEPGARSPRPGFRVTTGLGWPDDGADGCGLGWSEAWFAVVPRETAADDDDHRATGDGAGSPRAVAAESGVDEERRRVGTGLAARELGTPELTAPAVTVTDVPASDVTGGDATWTDVTTTGASATEGELPGADASALRTGSAGGVRGRAAQSLPRPVAPRILTVANQKGGVGKTTSAVNIATALALHGLEVLVIDLDPQGNASTALGIDHHAEVPSVYDVLIDGQALADVVQPAKEADGLSCAPATIDLAGAEIELVSMVARELRLQRALAALHQERAARGQRRLDYVLIDCPPSLGLLTVNALVAGDEVLIPIQCEYYALEGVGQLLRNIDLVKSHLNPALRISTILLTMYDARTRLAAQVADEVRSHFAGVVLPTAIPRSVRISEAPSFGQTVITYDPGSSGALSYLQAARELACRGQGSSEGTDGT